MSETNHVTVPFKPGWYLCRVGTRQPIYPGRYLTKEHADRAIEAFEWGTDFAEAVEVK